MQNWCGPDGTVIGWSLPLTPSWLKPQQHGEFSLLLYLPSEIKKKHVGLIGVSKSVCRSESERAWLSHLSQGGPVMYLPTLLMSAQIYCSYSEQDEVCTENGWMNGWMTWSDKTPLSCDYLIVTSFAHHFSFLPASGMTKHFYKRWINACYQ